MIIKDITYCEARLISTAQYENARIEVGCTISLDNLSDNHHAAPIEAQKFVRDALTNRIIDMEMDAKKKVYSDEAARVTRKYRL